jgi:tRNA threonylcarbamoyladenosine modification (KEOPS) complex  Pcc1 subunit
MIDLEIKVDLEKEKAKNFFKSILPDLKEKFPRSEIRVSQKKSGLIFNIHAADKTAARATLNSIKKPLILFNELEELK